MIPRACCRKHLAGKARVGVRSAQEALATLRTAYTVVPSTTRRSRNQHRALGTTSTSGVPAGRERATGTGEGEGTGTAGSATSAPYVLPAPTWSLSDLNVVTNDEVAVDSARAALSSEEVAKLCALAHIELAPEGGGSSTCGDSGAGSGIGSSGNLDVATVQKDVGAMLRCMQTMRREGRENESKGEDDEEEKNGPWGGAAPWAAPLQEDVVSDGDIQEKVLGAAQRSEDGFFTAPRVIEK